MNLQEKIDAGKITRTRYYLARNMRSRRLQLGITTTEAAYRSGVADASWRSMETARRWPSDDVLERVARVLGVTPGSLLEP